MAELSKEKVIKAVEETGFPLELRAAELFAKRDYRVASSLYYIDKDEAKGREIDLRVLLNRTKEHNQNTYFVRYCILVECKRYKKRPWVVFTNSQTDYDAYLSKLDFKGGSERKWAKNLEETLYPHHPLFNAKRMARGYAEIFREGNQGDADGAIFGAISTAVKATVATKEAGFAAGDYSICIYYPLVILDGSLWEAHLVGGETDANEIGWAVVSHFYESPNYSSQGFRVPIVVEKALPDFLEKLEKSLDKVSDLIFSNMAHFKEPKK